MSYNNLNQTYRRAPERFPMQLKSDRNLFNPTAIQHYMLGADYDMCDGRKFRYCKNGSVALVRAFMGQSEAPAATTVGVDVPQTGYTGALGAKKFNILLGTGNNYSNSELIDGMLYFNKSPVAGSTVGDYYIIKDNYWTTSDTVMNIEIADDGGLRTAFIATDELSVLKNMYRDIIVMPTTATAKAVGVPLADVAVDYYYWAQYRGWCPIIVDDGETVVIGEVVGYPGTIADAGACGIVGAGTDAVWGVCVMIGATDEPAIVDLMLP